MSAASGARGTKSTLWPSVRYEQKIWRPPADGGGMAGKGKRYRAAVVPRIADSIMMLPSECALISEDVRTAIATFDARVGDTLAPLEALLVRTEASASSRLERVDASMPDLLLAQVGEDQGRSAADVIGNIDATTAAIVLSDEITADTILEIHQALLSESEPEIAGKWRDEPVWIGSYAGGPPAAIFVPPESKRILECIDDLCEFMNRTDMPVFVQAMVMHAQFETIHPFPDGNGRVGRALIHAMLRRDGLSKSATLPISAGIVSQKHRYIEALTEYRAGDFVAIVELGADATFAALQNASYLFGDVETVVDRWNDLLGSVRSDSLAHRIVHQLLSFPIISVALMAERLGASPSSIRSAIARLLDLGVLSPMRAPSSRSKRWVAHDVIRVLDTFTDRSINPFGRH